MQYLFPARNVKIVVLGMDSRGKYPELKWET